MKHHCEKRRDSFVPSLCQEVKKKLREILHRWRWGPPPFGNENRVGTYKVCNHSDTLVRTLGVEFREGGRFTDDPPLHSKDLPSKVQPNVEQTGGALETSRMTRLFCNCTRSTSGNAAQKGDLNGRREIKFLAVIATDVAKFAHQRSPSTERPPSRQAVGNEIG